MTSIPSWAARGAEVVFLGDDAAPWLADDYPWVASPEKGVVYVIEEVIADDEEGPFLVLRGLANSQHAIELFRPVLRRKTEAEDVAKFSHHLTQRQPEGLDA